MSKEKLKPIDKVVLLILTLSVLSGVIPLGYWVFNPELSQMQVFLKFLPMDFLFICIGASAIKWGLK